MKRKGRNRQGAPALGQLTATAGTEASMAAFLKSNRARKKIIAAANWGTRPLAAIRMCNNHIMRDMRAQKARQERENQRLFLKLVTALVAGIVRGRGMRPPDGQCDNLPRSRRRGSADS